MTITIANETSLYSGSFGVSVPHIAKINTGIAVGVLEDDDTTEIIGKVITATSGISLGSSQVINDGLSGLVTIQELIELPDISDRFIMISENNTSADFSAQAVNRSGNTLAEQTIYDLDNNLTTTNKTGIATSGSPIFAATTTQAATDFFVRSTVSGTTITPDTPVSAGTGFGTCQAMVGLNLTDFMFCYLNTNDLMFQIIQAPSSTYTEGTIDDSTENASSAQMVRLDADKCLVAFVDSDDSNLKLMTVNRSGTSISGYGSPLTIGVFSNYTLARVSSSKVLLAWLDSGDLKAQSYSVSGDTITADGNTGTLSPVSTINTLHGLAVVDTDIAVIGWKDNPDDAYVARLSGFGAINYSLTHSQSGIPGAILI